ncbi:MAG: BMP family ABC transporter substrate-binding protein, partial [Deltaproteobacteria bacterium]|nr:BMP family ABC transporter substrate-binding protein [Deltaproteobacteria bacterium]
AALALVFSFSAVLSLSAPASAAEPSAVLVVTGLLGDKSFNDSANRGFDALKAAGWKTKVIEIGRDQTKWEPAYMDLAESGEWDLIVTNGSNASETVEDVSKEFPEQKFVLYDSELKDGFPNIYAISYKQNEGSYVAGALAGLVTKSSMKGANPQNVIGFIGGMEHPIITDFLVGFIEGAKAVNPDVKVIVSYIGSWDDTAKGKEVAMAQFQQGADVVFPAAEQAGLGCVEAAKELGRYIIGVDSDQAMLFKGADEASADAILTSVLKNVDKSLARAGQLFLAGQLPLGTFESLGIVEDGAGIAYNEYYEKNVPQDIRDQVEKARLDVVEGRAAVTSALSAPAETIGRIIDSVKP